MFLMLPREFVLVYLSKIVSVATLMFNERSHRSPFYSDKDFSCGENTEIECTVHIFLHYHVFLTWSSQPCAIFA